MIGTVRRAPLPWLAGGILLGLLQMTAIWMKKPLGVSTQFVVADTQVLEVIAPDYVEGHPLIRSEKYRKPGYGWWLAIGLLIGAFGASLAVRRNRWRTTSIWWDTNGRAGTPGRMTACFFGGLLILFGARLARGCTSGQFMSGWAQLSLSAIPFTIAMFAAAMLTARIVYPKTPSIEGEPGPREPVED